jgi:acyl-CoA synthetase (AMP-forming)/AMP-acid ligase II
MDKDRTGSLPRTIPHVVLRAAGAFGDRPAVIDPDGSRVTNFKTLGELMEASAGAFHAAGVKKGDRIAIWAPNSLEWIVAATGIQAVGACIVTLNTRFKGVEAQYILNKSRARMLVTVDTFLGASYLDMLKGLDLPHLERKIVIGEKGPTGWDAFLAAATDANRAAAMAVLESLTGNELSDIMFTSGTTGNPKGVMSSHAQNVGVYALYGDTMGMNQNDRTLVLYPFFHCAGYKAGWLANSYVGGAIVPESVLNPATLGKLIERLKLTYLPGPPTLFQTMLSQPPETRGDVSSVHTAITGAANVPPALIERMRGELGINRVLVGYGLTETCGTVSLTHQDDTAETIVSTVGKTIPGMEVKVVDESGKALPLGEAGEIIVRGYNVMLGYFEDEKATREAIDSDGWLHTGDIGTLDARNYIKITDRKKDMFIVGGFNCYPAEIEKILATHPAVMLVAVVGVPDERMGEVGKAYVVLRPGAKATEAEVIAWCRENMANFKVPRSVEFLDALPVNATGKVQKFRLRDTVAAKAGAA